MFCSGYLAFHYGWPSIFYVFGTYKRNLQGPAATSRPPRNHFIDVAALHQYYYKYPMNNPRSVK